MTTMTDGQIKRLLKRTERRVLLKIFSLPALGWGMIGASSLLLCWADFAAMALFAGTLQMWPAVQTSRETAAKLREFKLAPALHVWREIAEEPNLSLSDAPETDELKMSLRSVYNTDKRGEVLPLIQATRLLFIYDLQRRRFATILERGARLRQVREQLVEKAARLRELGDHNALTASSLEEMGDEIATLDRLGDETLSSCHRLEMIVLSVQRAVQVKQLHREVADLKSSVSPSKTDSAQLVAPEITDIERQIGREIETFLQLERETDAHLREL